MTFDHMLGSIDHLPFLYVKSNQVYSLNLVTRHVRYIHFHVFTRKAYSKITTFFLSVDILNDNLYKFR